MGCTTLLFNVTVPPDAATDRTSDIVRPLRRFDETGIFQAQIQSAGSPGAQLVIEGRASPEAPWFVFDTYDKLDMDTDNNLAVVVSLMPEMRARSLVNGAASYLHQAWLIE